MTNHILLGKSLEPSHVGAERETIFAPGKREGDYGYVRILHDVMWATAGQIYPIWGFRINNKSGAMQIVIQVKPAGIILHGYDYERLAGPALAEHLNAEHAKNFRKKIQIDD